MSYTKNKKEDFCKKIKEKYPLENLEVLVYNGAKMPGVIKCNKCGKIYEINQATHFLDKAKKKICFNCFPREDTVEVGHKVKYLFDNNDKIQLLNKYIKITDNLEIKCLKCGQIFKRMPRVFLKSQKCPYCETFSTFKTEEVFKQQLKEQLHDEYELIGEYKGTNATTLFRHVDCGFIFKNTPHNILQRTPCPRCKKFNSKGEIRIRKYLDNKNIKYEQQKRYSQLSNLLSFDFFIIEKKILIEFQGEQHFHPIKHFGGEKKYLKQVENDNIKRNFCKENNLILLEIKYTDYENIESILDKWLND